MRPLVTVIIPVYNAEHCIRKTMMSVLEQPNADKIELLIVDDGSIDDSAKVCNELAENNPCIRVFQKENGGVSSARNLGIDQASGKYLAFLDSDDWWENGFLNNGLITELMRPDSSDLYCFAFQKVSPNKKWKKEYHVGNEVKIYETPGLSHVIGQPHSAFLYRREYLLRKGFRYLPAKTWEDVTFTQLCCTFANSITSIDRIMFSYWMNYDSCMHRADSMELFMGHYKAEYMVKSVYEENGLAYGIDQIIVSLIGDYLKLISAENSYRFVKRLLDTEEFQLLQNSDVQPWKRLQKDVKLWRKNPFCAYLKFRLMKGIPRRLKRLLLSFPPTRPIAEYLQYRIIERWSMRTT